MMINGATVEHLKNFQGSEVTHRQEVKLMSGTGVVDLTPSWQFSLDYVVPKSRPKNDWYTIEDATVVVRKSGGDSYTYSGVSCLSVGEETIDGENETVVKISFIANSRD